MCSNEVPVGKCLSDSFPIKIGLKQGEVSTLFFFNFVWEYAIKRFQSNQWASNLIVRISFG